MQALRRLTLTNLRRTLRSLRTLTNPHTIPPTLTITLLPHRIRADAAQTHATPKTHTTDQQPTTPFLTSLSKADPIALSQARGHPPAGLPPALAEAAQIALSQHNTTLATAALAHLADLASSPLNHVYFSESTINTLQNIFSQQPSYIARLFGAQPLPPQVLHHATRVVANLASEIGTHALVLSAPSLLNQLCAILQTAQGDTLHDAIRAVSALSKTDPYGVVAGGGHIHLITFAKQGTERLFAAAGIRNLARHIDDLRVHRELVVAGVVNALVECLNQPDQAAVFAILAFGDLMTTNHPKKHIIQRRLQPAYQPFADLLNEKNPLITRAMYRALQSMFENGQGDVVPKPMAVLLADQCGQLVNGACARGDLAALKAVRFMCKDFTVSKGMVDKGLLEVLVRGVKQGKGEYWEQCTAALASLSNQDQHTQLLISRGALRAVIGRPFLEHNAVHAASFFANMARSPDLHAEVAHGGLRVLLLALSSKDQAAVKEGARGVFNLSLGGVSKVMIGQRVGLLPLITAARGEGDSRKFAVGTLAEISDAFEQATKMIEADIVSVLLTAVREDPSLARAVAKCIANLSLVAETHGSLAQTGAAEWLVDMISRNGGRGPDAADVLHFCTAAVCNIAYSPGITRTTLREKGAVRILTALSSSGMSAALVLHSAKTALNNLRGEKPVFVPVDGALRTPSPA